MPRRSYCAPPTLISSLGCGDKWIVHWKRLRRVGLIFSLLTRFGVFHCWLSSGFCGLPSRWMGSLFSATCSALGTGGDGASYGSEWLFSYKAVSLFLACRPICSGFDLLFIAFVRIGLVRCRYWLSLFFLWDLIVVSILLCFSGWWAVVDFLQFLTISDLIESSDWRSFTLAGFKSIRFSFVICLDLF